MKNTGVKKIIAAALAVSMIPASAVLFTGCGKTEAPAVTGTQPWSAGSEVTQQATAPSGPIDLTGFISEIVDKKQYKIEIEDYEIGPMDSFFDCTERALFKVVANSPIVAGGYTFTKTADEKLSEEAYGRAQYDSEWEISAGDTKLGTISLDTTYLDDWGGYGKTNLFQLSAKKKKTDTASSPAVEIKSKSGQYELDAPPMMTAEECKQHLPEIEKIINDTVAFGDYKDKNLSLDSIYYGKITRNEGRGTYDVVDFSVFYADGEGRYYSATYTYPFLDGTQVKASWCNSILQEDRDPASIGDNNPDLTWVKLK